MRHLTLLCLVFTAGWWLGGPAAREGTAAGGPPDFAAVVARVDPSVVRVIVRSSTASADRSRDDGVGAGFVVDPAGLIVTSRHVVSGAQRIVVTLPGHGALDATLVGQDEATDTALLRVAVGGLAPLPAADPRRLRVGEWILACGSPYSMANSWSVGIVSGLGRTNVGVGPRSLRDFIQTDAAANLGNSGGPLLDGDGRVVGVMTAILSRTGGHQGVALAVPIDVVLAAVARMRGGPTAAQPPTLGLRVRELPSVADTPPGLLVTGFDAGSSALDSGLLVRDVVLQADGLPLRRTADLQRAVWAKTRGQVVVLVIQRDRRRFEVRVPLR
ncbi:MAG: trypsin-like peptidase domain-containing protein [Planctomycetota bacterium]|nr:trypsin-like peptidase domain-containing protein [Planctomycetota bacterium]